MNVTEKKYIKGADLKAGDNVSVWWANDNGARVLEERPYTGKLAHLWPGVRIRIIKFTANTKSGTTEMTVADSDLFTVVP
jgi:hypothetical protein